MQQTAAQSPLSTVARRVRAWKKRNAPCNICAERGYCVLGAVEPDIAPEVEPDAAPDGDPEGAGYERVAPVAPDVPALPAPIAEPLVPAPDVVLPPLIEVVLPVLPCCVIDISVR